MKKISFDVDKNLCGECSIALMRFIGNMEGVEAITAENGEVVINFDESKVGEEALYRITRDSIERLGYKFSHE